MMADHLDPCILSFFSLAVISRNIRQIRQICQLLSVLLEFRKTQLSASLMYLFEIKRAEKDSDDCRMRQRTSVIWSTYRMSGKYLKFYSYVYQDGIACLRKNLCATGFRRAFNALNDLPSGYFDLFFIRAS